MILINIAYNQINRNKLMENNYKLMLANLIEARNHYLDTNNLTVINDSIFREFTIECIGETMEQSRIQRLLIESRKKNNKPYVFRYEPSEKKKKIPNYIFDNSSGNKVTNVKHKQIK